MSSYRRRARIAALSLLMLGVAAAFCPASRKSLSRAESQVERFRGQFNNARFQDIYAGTDDEFQKSSPEPKILAFLADTQHQLGVFQRAERRRFSVYWTTKGTLVTLLYDSTYEHGTAQEEFIWVISGDSAKLRKYWIHSLRLSPGSTARVVSLSKGPVRLVPVLASAAYLDGLQRFYREHLAIDVEVMRPLEPDRSAWDSARQQWMGERLIEQLARVSGTNDAVVIGVLGDDMYVLSENWRYAFAMRSDDNRLAIVSYARMNPLFWGEPRDADRLQLRLRKMVTKELGLMRFGLPASSNPESPMYGNIGGVEDLDLMHDDPIEGGFPTRS